jgi:hypothetical protein
VTGGGNLVLVGVLRVTGMEPDQEGVMREKLGLSKRCGFALLGVAVIVLPIALVAGCIDLPTFSAVGVMWLIVSVMMIMGESVTEVTVWTATIKRDVQAAKDARDQAEAVRDELRFALKSLIESSEIAFSVTRITECSDGVLKRRQASIERLQEFAEPDAVKLRDWQQNLDALLGR